MALSSRASLAAPHRCATRRPAGRSTTVVVKAFSLKEASDVIAKAFVTIFSKPETNVDSFAENNFSGKISRERRPFRDGFSSPNAPMDAMKPTEQEAETYLDGAVKRLVSNNFKGDQTEPSWGGNQGWTGDRTAKSGHQHKEGFHSRKL